MKFAVNDYKVEKIKSKYLITTAHGSWTALNKREFCSLKSEKPGKVLVEKLETKGIVITENNVNSIISRYRNRNLMLFGGTSLHIVVPTLRCNMKCLYCHASSKGEKERGYDMDEKTARKTVDFIFQGPARGITIEFQGGEPLLNFPVVKCIVEYAKKKNEEHGKGMNLAIVTNLSRMDEKKLKFLVDNNVSVCTSLDGPKKLHDRNRRLAGGSNYDEVVGWIKKANRSFAKKETFKSKVEALITLTRDSLKYPHEIVDEYVKNKLDVVHLRFLNQLGIAKSSWPRISYTVEEYLKFWKETVDYIIELNKEGKSIQERMVKIILQKILTDKDPNYLELKSPCGAAIGQLAYDYNGDIYSCDEGRMVGEDMFKLGNVKSSTYKDVTTSRHTCSLITSSINDTFCSPCAFQPYCGICPVCNYTEQGSVIAKIPETSRCKIYKEQFLYVFSKLIFEKDAAKVLKGWIKKDQHDTQGIVK